MTQFIFINLFSGAGGTTTGAEASGVAKVVAAVNHDPVAIASHTANHPDTVHFIEDIRTLHLGQLQHIVAAAKQRHPQALVVLWGSPDCTHFSRAKSGPKNRDTRSLAEEIPRYVSGLDVDIVMVENVEEFTSWGPLDDTGRPLSRHEGRDYTAWVASICALGYKYQHRILNAADYGAHTTRRRYFGMFHRPHVVPAWPQPTHAKNPVRDGLFTDPRKPWRPVREVLEMDNHGRSIFSRPKPLVDRTLRRLMDGLRKFAAAPQVMTCNSPGYCQPITQPVGAVTAAGHKALVTPMLLKYYRTGTMVSTDDCAPTVTTRDRMALVSPVKFDEKLRGRPVQSPVQFLDYNYGAQRSSGSVEAPAGAVTASPKISVVTTWVVNPQFSLKGTSVNVPAPTVVACQKSYPLSIATAARCAAPHWHATPGDTETMLELKKVMQSLGIGDIYLRMLNEAELARIQGFPAGYILHGTSAHRKKQIGNAVVSCIPEAWLRALDAAQRANFHSG